MIWGYFTKALQGPQLRRFCNIVLGIHEDDIPAYNASVRAFLEEKKLKPKEDKKEAQEADKFLGE